MKSRIKILKTPCKQNQFTENTLCSVSGFHLQRDGSKPDNFDTILTVPSVKISRFIVSIKVITGFKLEKKRFPYNYQRFLYKKRNTLLLY